MKTIIIAAPTATEQRHLDVLVNSIRRDMADIKISKEAMERVFTAAELMVPAYDPLLIDSEMLMTVCDLMSDQEGAVLRDTIITDGVMYPIPCTDAELELGYASVKNLSTKTDPVFASVMGLVGITINNTLLAYLV